MTPRLCCIVCRRRWARHVGFWAFCFRSKRIACVVQGEAAQAQGMHIAGPAFISRPVVAGNLRYFLVCMPVRRGGVVRRALSRLRVPCQQYGCAPSRRARYGFPFQMSLSMPWLRLNFLGAECVTRARLGVNGGPCVLNGPFRADLRACFGPLGTTV